MARCRWTFPRVILTMHILQRIANAMVGKYTESLRLSPHKEVHMCKTIW